MASLEEVFRDREKYPDDQMITVAGQEISMKEFRNQALPKADATRFGERARQEANVAAQRAQELENQLLEAQQKMALLSQSTQSSSQDYADPYTEKMTALQRQQEEIVRRLQEHETGFYMAEYNRQLEALAHRDKNMNREELVNFAKQRQIMNLEDAYHLKYRDRIMKEASEKAAAEAREKALKEARMPRIPSPSVRRPTDKPALTWDDASNAASDPEMWQAFESVDES